MAEFSRRQALAVSGIGLVLAGCGAMISPITGPDRSAVGPDWGTLASRIRGALFLPGDLGYGTARLIQNPRYDDAQPLAVLAAASPVDVVMAVRFAGENSIPLVVRSGGHSYSGHTAGGSASAGTMPSLVIDLRRLRDVVVRANGTAKVSAGASLARVYSALGSADHAIAAGSCATVSMCGLTLCGGIGPLARAYGLSCDALIDFDIVTADGDFRTIDPGTDPELFWACRGGGGQLGVITAMTFETRSAPTVFVWSLNWPAGAAAEVIAAWQKWAPRAHEELWSALTLQNGPDYQHGPELAVTGTWLGAASELPEQLAPFLNEVGRVPSHNDSVARDYLSAMMQFAGCSDVPLARCTTDAGGALTRESVATTSHVPTAPADAAGIEELVSRVSAAATVPGLRHGGITLHAMGGAVRDVAPADSAFPYRNAIMTAQYTAAFQDGTSPAPHDEYVLGFREAMQPWWGDGAYLGFAGAAVAEPVNAYLGGNAARLQRVKHRYDPDNRFAPALVR